MLACHWKKTFLARWKILPLLLPPLFSFSFRLSQSLLTIFLTISAPLLTTFGRSLSHKRDSRMKGNFFHPLFLLLFNPPFTCHFFLLSSSSLSSLLALSLLLVSLFSARVEDSFIPLTILLFFFSSVSVSFPWSSSASTSSSSSLLLSPPHPPFLPSFLSLSLSLPHTRKRGFFATFLQRWKKIFVPSRFLLSPLSLSLSLAFLRVSRRKRERVSLSLSLSHTSARANGRRILPPPHSLKSFPSLSPSTSLSISPLISREISLHLLSLSHVITHACRRKKTSPATSFYVATSSRLLLFSSSPLLLLPSSLTSLSLFLFSVSCEPVRLNQPWI